MILPVDSYKSQFTCKYKLFGLLMLKLKKNCCYHLKIIRFPAVPEKSVSMSYILELYLHMSKICWSCVNGCLPLCWVTVGILICVWPPPLIAFNFQLALSVTLAPDSDSSEFVMLLYKKNSALNFIWSLIEPAVLCRSIYFVCMYICIIHPYVRVYAHHILQC